MSRVFVNDPGDQSLIPHRVIPKTQRMVLEAALLSSQYYKVKIKDKVEQSREWSNTPLHLGVVAIEKGAFESPSTKITNFTYFWGCPRGVMVKAMDCGIVVREFVLQSRYYVHFRVNILGKGMNPLILPAMG